MDIFQVVRKNDIDSYYQLIGKIDVNLIEEDTKRNLLLLSVANNCNEIAIDLLQKKINVNFQDEKGQTALHYVAVTGNLSLAKAIISAGGNVNISDMYGNNSLWTATFNARGNYDIVKVFVMAGGDALHKNNNNKSSIDFATQIGDNSLIDILSNG